MTLKKCIECGKEVSDKAFACPQCGSSDPTRAGAKLLKALFIIIGIVFIALVSFITFSSASETNPKSIEDALESIRLEPNVLDTHYEPGAAVEWNIGVQDDGSKRYGFASYICDILHEHNSVSQNTSVRVVDILKITHGQNFRKASLGRVNCSTYEQSDP